MILRSAVSVRNLEEVALFGRNTIDGHSIDLLLFVFG